MRAPILVVGATALAVVLAACGSNTTAADTATVTDAVTAALMPDATGSGPFTAETADCAAAGMIDAVGVPRLLEIVGGLGSLGAGDPTAIFGRLTPDELTQALAAVEGCIDMSRAVIDTLELYGFTPDVAACLGTNLVTETDGGAIVESFLLGTDPTADTGFATAFLTALADPCRPATHGMFVADLTAYGVGAGGATCVADAFLASDNLSDLVAAWTGVDTPTVDPIAINDQITGTFTDCLTDDELTALGIDTTTTTTSTTAP